MEIIPRADEGALRIFRVCPFPTNFFRRYRFLRLLVQDVGLLVKKGASVKTIDEHRKRVTTFTEHKTHTQDTNNQSICW